MSLKTLFSLCLFFPLAHPYWAGLLLAVATVPVLVLIPISVAHQWGALLLALFDGAYVGFAARDGHTPRKAD